MKRLIATALLVLFLFPAHLFAAGSAVVETVTPLKDMYKVSLAWTSDDASGGLSIALTAGTMALIYGRSIEAVVTTPGTGGDAPTALYDVTLIDSNSADVLGGVGANRSATVTERVKPFIGAVYDSVLIDSALTLVVATAGNSKKGIVTLLCR